MKIDSKEVFLIERYVSLEYLAELREIWEEMVLHVDACLAKFVEALPLDYRNRSLPEQPDIVWGDRVIPNFRSTLQNLNDGVIALSHGDLSGLGCAHGPLNDFKGQMEFWSGWMEDADEQRYGGLLHAAVLMASNITATEAAHWNPGDLSTNYHEESRGPLAPPAMWPTYQNNSRISVASGSELNISGIYVPNLENSCAQFLSARYKTAPLATVFIRMRELFAPDTGIKYGETAEFATKPCVWEKVELVRKTSNVLNIPTLVGEKIIRVPAGDRCPQSGYYFTPARPDSRRRFAFADVMPDFEGAYGATIWQWDQNQT